MLESTRGIIFWAEASVVLSAEDRHQLHCFQNTRTAAILYGCFAAAATTPPSVRVVIRTNGNLARRRTRSWTTRVSDTASGLLVFSGYPAARQRLCCALLLCCTRSTRAIFGRLSTLGKYTVATMVDDSARRQVGTGRRFFDGQTNTADCKELKREQTATGWSERDQKCNYGKLQCIRHTR